MAGDTPSADSPQSSFERRLATILMADVAGYSRMMGEDEERTVETLRGHREVFDALLRMHRGRIFNTAGDAVLAEFPSAVEAVRCATEVQAALRTRNEHLAPEQRMQFRIGINLGDVIVQGTDLLGDGVNVAARIQTVAEPGGICIAGSVYDQIQNKLTLQFRQLGPQTFKNIAQPIRTFSIAEAQDAARPAPAVPARFGRKPLLGAGAAIIALALIGGGVFAFREYQARAADEARRVADAQREAEARRKADADQRAAFDRQAEQQRAAAEAAQREASLQAELKAAKDALQQRADAARKAEMERKLADATGRAEAAERRAREVAAKPSAAVPMPPPGRAAPPAVAPPSPAPAAGGIERFDGNYRGQLCHMGSDAEAARGCWAAALKVENGRLLATWVSPNTGRPAYVRGSVSTQGAVAVTLHGWGRNGQQTSGSMTGTWSDDAIKVSGTWQNGAAISAQWTRAR